MTKWRTSDFRRAASLVLSGQRRQAENFTDGDPAAHRSGGGESAARIGARLGRGRRRGPRTVGLEELLVFAGARSGGAANAAPLWIERDRVGPNRIESGVQIAHFGKVAGEKRHLDRFESHPPHSALPVQDRSDLRERECERRHFRWAPTVRAWSSRRLVEVAVAPVGLSESARCFGMVRGGVEPSAYRSSGRSRKALWPVRGRTMRKWRSVVNMASVRYAAARATLVASINPMPFSPSVSAYPSATAIAALMCSAAREPRIGGARHGVRSGALTAHRPCAWAAGFGMRGPDRAAAPPYSRRGTRNVKGDADGGQRGGSGGWWVGGGADVVERAGAGRGAAAHRGPALRDGLAARRARGGRGAADVAGARARGAACPRL